jgi:hypothetical protein
MGTTPQFPSNDQMAHDKSDAREQLTGVELDLRHWPARQILHHKSETNWYACGEPKAA